MHKSTGINIIIVLALLWLAGAGFYLYNKSRSVARAPEENIAVNSTGGTLTMTQTPVQAGANADNAISDNSVAADKKVMNHVTIDTDFGKIVLELYPKDAPKAAANFATLAEKGFYNGLIFHRVISGFMIQGGDPAGNGTGGAGYTFADELNPDTPSYKAGYRKGVLAMANAGPNTNGSQFFIMLADYPLPHNYTIFGRVVSGQDVVDKIGAVKTGANDRPVTPVVMKSVIASE